MKFDEIILAIDPEEDYTVAQLVEKLEVSQSAIISHIRKGTFPARKIFNKYYIQGRHIRDYYAGKVA